jgi:hypothetical protein
MTVMEELNDLYKRCKVQDDHRASLLSVVGTSPQFKVEAECQALQLVLNAARQYSEVYAESLQIAVGTSCLHHQAPDQLPT